ncbi:MAG TPA: flagellar assembly protein FliX [Magnetovibrio sp.]
MKIGHIEQGKSTDRAKRKSDVSGGSGTAFASQLRSASQSSGAHSVETGVVDHAALDGVDALLAMQEVGDESEEKARKQATNYGEELLKRLNVIQDALLMGAIPKDTLMDMAKKLRGGRVKVQDPRLNEILDAIELRVEVEIAKYTRSL